MLTAESTGFWGRAYTIAENGTPITTWDNSWWKSGGTFELAGRTYHVRANMWGSRYTMLDPGGAVFAEAERVGRKNWTVHAGGRTYEFRRTSIFKSDQHLMDGERTVGTIRRTSPDRQPHRRPAWPAAAVAGVRARRPDRPVAVRERGRRRLVVLTTDVGNAVEFLK
ncbi:hypothetical protein Q0Z83_002830 [Actinoplanes sichuanensis]|uniref:hypothetical protein n=1 Tax=Actinoplanes sichuanensis TaxID=512349 RepID=UPI0029544DF4|nr:hypothetical protein [Actinoplanes sichuanensis]BEL02092.1 hypothetical protein Q0Z83_002830 [Actinoplanes sichuanensis]